MEDYIINIKRLHKFYGEKCALKSVDIAIKKGSVYGLIGQNGAGKTTLIRILNTIIEFDEGEILFQNKPLQSHHVNSIGYLPEERGLYKNMTIEEQALYFGQLKGMTKLEAKKQLNFWLDRFDIKDWNKKKIEDLSKGMAQKVQFLITVLHQPELLILDEPFSGFDPLNAQLIADEIKRLAKQGTTVIFSSHRMESVTQMCDALSLIHKGEIILEGSIDEIRTTHANEIYEITLSEFDAIKLDSFLNNVVTYTVTLKEQTESTVRLEVANVYDTSDALLKEMLNIGSIKVFKQHIPDLQEIFIKTIENA